MSQLMEHYWSVFMKLNFIKQRQLTRIQLTFQRLFLNVLQSTEGVKQLPSNFENAVRNAQFKFATMQQMPALEQSSLADIVRILYPMVFYNMYFTAYQECRSSHIPVSIISPSVLQQRITEIEKQLPKSVKLAISSEEIQRNYTLPFAQCNMNVLLL